MEDLKKIFPGNGEPQTNAHDFVSWAKAFLKCPWKFPKTICP